MQCRLVKLYSARLYCKILQEGKGYYQVALRYTDIGQLQ